MTTHIDYPYPQPARSWDELIDVLVDYRSVHGGVLALHALASDRTVPIDVAKAGYPAVFKMTQVLDALSGTVLRGGAIVATKARRIERELLDAGGGDDLSELEGARSTTSKRVRLYAELSEILHDIGWYLGNRQAELRSPPKPADPDDDDDNGFLLVQSRSEVSAPDSDLAPTPAAMLPSRDLGSLLHLFWLLSCPTGDLSFARSMLNTAAWAAEGIGAAALSFVAGSVRQRDHERGELSLVASQLIELGRRLVSFGLKSIGHQVSEIASVVTEAASTAGRAPIAT